MFSKLAFLLSAGLFLSGCLHPFQQKFSSSHDVNFTEVDMFASLAEAVYEDEAAIQVACARAGYPNVVVRCV